MENETLNSEFEESGVFNDIERCEQCLQHIGMAFLQFIPDNAAKLGITNDECFAFFRRIYEDTFASIEGE